MPPRRIVNLTVSIAQRALSALGRGLGGLLAARTAERAPYMVSRVDICNLVKLRTSDRRAVVLSTASSGTAVGAAAQRHILLPVPLIPLRASQSGTGNRVLDTVDSLKHSVQSIIITDQTPQPGTRLRSAETAAAGAPRCPDEPLSASMEPVSLCTAASWRRLPLQRPQLSPPAAVSISCASAM